MLAGRGPHVAISVDSISRQINSSTNTHLSPTLFREITDASFDNEK